MFAALPQSFFHWLDEGEGADLKLPNVSRETLASEKLHVIASRCSQHALRRQVTCTTNLRHTCRKMLRRCCSSFLLSKIVQPCSASPPRAADSSHASWYGLQYCSRDERDATAAEVGEGGLLRFVGSGAPVHTLSPEDSDMLASPLRRCRVRDKPNRVQAACCDLSAAAHPCTRSARKTAPCWWDTRSMTTLMM